MAPTWDSPLRMTGHGTALLLWRSTASRSGSPGRMRRSWGLCVSISWPEPRWLDLAHPQAVTPSGWTPSLIASLLCCLLWRGNERRGKDLRQGGTRRWAFRRGRAIAPRWRNGHRVAQGASRMPWRVSATSEQSEADGLVSQQAEAVNHPLNHENSLELLPWLLPPGFERSPESRKSLSCNSRGGTRTRDPGIMSASVAPSDQRLTSEHLAPTRTDAHRCAGKVLPWPLPLFSREIFAA